MKPVKFVDQPVCDNCGGRHYGSPRGYFPYIKARCVVCGVLTIYACSDCAIDSGGKESVHVCEKGACQRKHEQSHPDRKPSDLSPDFISYREKVMSMKWEVLADKQFKNDWRVEAIDEGGDIFVALFSGPESEQRAREYADFKTNTK